MRHDGHARPPRNLETAESVASHPLFNPVARYLRIPVDEGAVRIVAPCPDMQLVECRRGTPLPIMFERGGGGSDRARLICGFLGCDERPYNPLLSALPRMIHLSE